MRNSKENVDLKKRINILRAMYLTSGAQIYTLRFDDIDKFGSENGFTVPKDAFGILTNDNKLMFNVDHVLTVNDKAPRFIYTPSVTILCGPTFIHALEWGYYRLVCNFAGKIDNLTEQDVLQHARDLKQWFITPRVVYPSHPNPSPECQDVDLTLEFMRDLGRDTPLIPLINKIPKQKKSFFGKIFGA